MGLRSQRQYECDIKIATYGYELWEACVVIVDIVIAVRWSWAFATAMELKRGMDIMDRGGWRTGPPSVRSGPFHRESPHYSLLDFDHLFYFLNINPIDVDVDADTMRKFPFGRSKSNNATENDDALATRTAT